jgi:choline-sulfatase
MNHAHPIALFLAAVMGLVSAVRAADEPRRPNILFIMTDDQARWSLGVHGNTDSRTPNMDRIGKEGAIFANAFVATPVCSPSRATFFTGRYGTQLGITDWINKPQAEAGVGLSDTDVTWPMVLQRAGYRTALVGKWHLGEKRHNRPRSKGFDHFYGIVGGGEQAMNPRMTIDGEDKRLEGPTPDLTADAAIRFIERTHGGAGAEADKPFALCLFFREPHQPYTPVPPEDSAPFEKLDPKTPNVPDFVDAETNKKRYREYYGSIHAADRNIGRVLAKLDELKLADNTIVLFTSDHGYNIGQHGVYTKGNASWISGAKAGPKRPNMFEESIRVPLLVRWPGVVKPGTTIDQMVSNVDTFKTVLGMLNIPVPADAPQADGRDFSPLLRGESVPSWREEIYTQYDLHNSGLAFMRMVRTPKWKLVRHHFTSGLDELYDLENDPGEKDNLYNKPAGKAARAELQSKLTAWQKSIDDPILKGIPAEAAE